MGFLDAIGEAKKKYDSWNEAEKQKDYDRKNNRLLELDRKERDLKGRLVLKRKEDRVARMERRLQPKQSGRSSGLGGLGSINSSDVFSFSGNSLRRGRKRDDIWGGV